MNGSLPNTVKNGRAEPRKPVPHFVHAGCHVDPRRNRRLCRCNQRNAQCNHDLTVKPPLLPPAPKPGTQAHAGRHNTKKPGNNPRFSMPFCCKAVEARLRRFVVGVDKHKGHHRKSAQTAFYGFRLSRMGLLTRIFHRRRVSFFPFSGISGGLQAVNQGLFVCAKFFVAFAKHLLRKS